MPLYPPAAPPTGPGGAHAATHETGGADELLLDGTQVRIDPSGLAVVLTDDVQAAIAELDAAAVAVADGLVAETEAREAGAPLRDTAANLAANNPTPAAGRLVAQIDPPFASALGDGVTPWLTLPKTYPDGGPAPTFTMKNDATISMVGSSAWADVDPSGTANARTYDLVVPGVVAGMKIEASLMCLVTSAAGAMLFDYWTVVAGAAVNQMGSNGGGTTGWGIETNVQRYLQGGYNGIYTLAVNDIENGSLRLRLRFWLASGSTRTLFSASGLRLVQKVRVYR